VDKAVGCGVKGSVFETHVMHFFSSFFTFFTSALLKAGEVFKSVSVVVVVVTFSVAQLMTFSFSAHLQKFNMVAIVVEAFVVERCGDCGDKES